jgi:hypothetical protein
MNKRLKEIDDIINKLSPNDAINDLIKKYELYDYKYIETVEDFSVLHLTGSLRYINKYTQELRYGGLLIKIYEKNTKWYGIIKKMSGKKYHISFNSNYIFYIEPKKKLLREWATKFITDYETGKYN